MAITSKSIALSIIFQLYLVSCVSSQRETKFLNHGFLGANILKFGSSKIHPNGLLELTNTSVRQMGQAFHGFPINFINPNSSTSISFSTSFVLAIIQGSGAPGHGMSFVIAPSMDFSGAFPSNYLGLFNNSFNGNSSNRILAVEFDTVQAVEMNDIDDNHVGIDLNGVVSIESASAAYFDDQQSKNISLKLASGEPIRVWIEYNATNMIFNVTLAPLKISKPNIPLLSRKLNLSRILSEENYIGFTGSTGTITSTHLILGWSFSIEGKASDFNIPSLPSLPDPPPPLLLPPSTPPVFVEKNQNNMKLIIIIAASATFAVAIMILLGFCFLLHTGQVSLRGGAMQFSYQTISSATDGFKIYLGEENSGRFFRGQLTSGQTIAVKKITCSTSKQVLSLLAKVFAISRVIHTNLVNLLGYTKQGNEVGLVYEYIQNGSLDHYLFSNQRSVLEWAQRLTIINGIASALQYLHGECQRVLIHGNIKSSNVLLNEDLHARLGDYGQGNMNNSTGHGAPELVAEAAVHTRETDVYGFGMLIMEIVSGRRAIDPTRVPEEVSLVNWVLQRFMNNELLQCCDVRMDRNELVDREVLVVLKLGLLCTNRSPEDRPNMRTVVQYLDGIRPLPQDEEIIIAP